MAELPDSQPQNESQPAIDPLADEWGQFASPFREYITIDRHNLRDVDD